MIGGCKLDVIENLRFGKLQPVLTKLGATVHHAPGWRAGHESVCREEDHAIQAEVRRSKNPNTGTALPFLQNSNSIGSCRDHGVALRYSDLSDSNSIEHTTRQEALASNLGFASLEALLVVDDARRA